MLKAPQPGSHDGRSLDPSPLAPPRHLSPDRHRHGSPDLAAHPASPGERGAYAWRGTQLSGRAHPLVFARRAVSREDAAALVLRVCVEDDLGGLIRTTALGHPSVERRDDGHLDGVPHGCGARSAGTPVAVRDREVLPRAGRQMATRVNASVYDVTAPVGP